MIGRILHTILFLLLMATPVAAQSQPTNGLDSSDPNTLQQRISRLVRASRLDAIPSLETLAADTSLTTRIYAARRTMNNSPNRHADPEAEYARALNAAAAVTHAAALAARRLTLLRDTGITCTFDLPQPALDQLASQGAVVMPWSRNEMYEWYNSEFPFVTTDFVYHTFMILVRAAIDELENLSFRTDLAALVQAWAIACGAQVNILDDPPLQDLARDNLAVLAVAALLVADGGTAALDDLGLDPVRRSHVEAETARVREATYRGDSLLLDRQEDYTEYRARGRASGNAGQGYFQARTWLARTMFPVADTRATRRALLLTAALLSEPTAWNRWVGLDEVTGILAGPQDDPDVRMYRDLAATVAGREGAAAVYAVLADDDLFAQFGGQARLWPAPLLDSSLGLGAAATMGLRLLGQRRSADGVLLQELSNTADWPISGLQVVAGLFDLPGEADLLADAGLSLAPSAASVAIDSVGLMSGYRQCHAALFETPAGLPEVFRSAVWRDKLVNSALGAWAETRHAAAPYLKSAHVYAGLSAYSSRLQGYVEPYPEFYRRLRKLAAAWDQVCRRAGVYEAVARQLRDDPKAHRLDAGRIPGFVEILETLTDLAERELQSLPQTKDDVRFLKTLGRRIRHLCFNDSNLNVAEEPMSRISDVATEHQSGQVLEAGVGLAYAVFVAVTDDDETVVCRGAVYSYHEFVVPLAARLDDTVWAGLSAGAEVLGRGPWLAGHSPLSWAPVFGTKELAAFQAAPWERAYVTGTFPWESRVRDYRPPSHWLGGHVAAADLEPLVTLAVRDDCDLELLRFATRELSRWSGQPVALAYWRSLIDEIVAAGDLRGGPHDRPTIRLFWALQALAKDGQPGDVERIRGIRHVLDRRNWGSRRAAAVEPALRWLVGVAETRNGGSGG